MKRLLLCTCFFTLIFSCSTSDDVQENNLELNFYGLTVGNSYTYKFYKYNSDTEDYDETLIVQNVIIEDTEEVSGQQYFKIKTTTSGVDGFNLFYLQNGEEIDYLREVDGTLINDNNDVLFVNNEFSEHLVNSDNTSLNLYRKTIEEPVIINSNTGSFNCIEMQNYIVTEDGTTLDGVSKIHYSEGVGLVQQTCVYTSSSTPVMIKKLNSYNIQN
ncbi:MULTISPECIES: hypothetical protein [unclassified Olleya]|jgi:hypothetical protein|uniref:hypothetical protein n=1 Tax=unclassified Olleya TaxID=2615019 RepID=UPI0011A67635|nr:hypothetical protein [Olleya sp. Hel_I_94]TVZ46247.1 hypothetical protein JM82_0816 [Olleya sp. Hel_I_94]